MIHAQRKGPIGGGVPACDIKTHNLGCGAGWSSLSYPIPKGSEHSHCTVNHTLGLQDGSKAQQEAGKGKQGQSGVHPESGASHLFSQGDTKNYWTSCTQQDVRVSSDAQELSSSMWGPT